MRQLVRAFSAVLLLLAIALLSALLTMRLAIHGAEVHVPALAGLPVAEAAQKLHSERIEATVEGRFYSATQPAGHVLTQSPAPGTLVRKAWPVRITVSLGPQRVAIPQVEGLDQNIAAMTIRRIGLQLGDVMAIPYGYAPENTVIAQTPLAKATDAQGPKVSLLTAKTEAPEPKASAMPDLTGEAFTAAAWAILHAGFELAPVQTQPASDVQRAATGAAGTGAPVSPPAATTSAPPGTVIAQSPPAGTRVLEGTMIRLTVQP
jgi:beta-lactam-binding protein with PASTA domain